ncbi:unnamed protein product, partial [Brenthis ino]
MEEDAGVKAPVTRRRQRISVEQSEESKSPALNTPTKKRGGRRAKPELELIDENSPNNTTRKTKKASAKEIKDAIEEKPVTPSRRSTRIKSNTSIVSETAIMVDSPRAKRAARRTSAVGSDSEATVTPIRQTRRTRKDSATSVEKAELPSTSKPSIQITQVIVEEPESNERKLASNAEDNDNSSTSSVRKSPRLEAKNKTPSKKKAKENDQPSDNTSEQSESIPSRKSIDSSLPTSQETEATAETQVSSKDNKETDRLSISSSDLIKDLHVIVPKIKTDNLNKTTSAIESKQETTKRKRTKSWTTLTVANESNFFSDNENTKKKITKNVKDLIQLNKSGAGDASINTSIQDKSFSRRKKNDSNNFIVEDIDTSLNKSKNKSQKEENKDDSLSANQDVTEQNSNIFELFKKEPSSDLRTLVLIDNDSDSNLEKDIQNKCQNEDQCVPVVEHPVRTEKEVELNLISKNQSIINKSSLNDSCEPMDVDESMPDSLLVEMQKNENNSSKRNLISQFSQLENSLSNKEILNKSKRKSSISNNLEKSDNENKSTLILSQIKDTSSSELNNAVKSPQMKATILSKTVEDLNVTQEHEVNKRNISLNCVTTSTPLQQKNLQKLALNVNTSMISTNEDSKNVIENVNSKNKDDIEDKGENSSNESDSSEDEKDIKEIRKKSKIQNYSKIMDSDDEMEVEKITSNDNSNNTKNQSLNISKKNLSQKQKDADTGLESADESLNIKKKRKPSQSSKKKPAISREMDSDDEVESDDESQDTSNFLDDKADDAGDDYESGDSQDENEREYAKQNEILEKGETFTSEDDFSDDTDYEKDSFVVSSAEEDDELLDGTEGDLSMSDNELKMSAKSKKKYNERKLKEQKKASKEMYESRHKLNTSSKTKKKQQISSSESEIETDPKPKKNNRMRLDSTNETSMLEDKDEQTKSNNKTKRLSRSVCDESAMNEKEITIANESIKDVDPLKTQIKEEPETPKKGNMSVAFIDSEEINNDEVDNNELTKTQTEIDPLDESMEDSLSSDTEIINNYDSVLEDLGKNNEVKTKTCDISLNLNKKIKKPKAPIVEELNLTQVKSSKKNKNKQTKEADKSKEQNTDDGASSDSIDLHLLFSEDSNQSDDVRNKDDNQEEFIPLERKDGKTDIRENIDTSDQVNNTSLNVSLKKKKKRKSKNDNNIDSNDTEEDKVSFFVDTEGTHTSVNKSINTSLENKKRLSTQNNDPQILSQKENEDLQIDQDETDFGTNQSMNKSLTKTPAKNKKKASFVNEEQQDHDSDEAPTEVSFKKEKRKNKTEAVSENQTDLATNIISINNTPVSEKKKKAKKAHVENQAEDENVSDRSLNASLSVKKKNISTGQVQETEPNEEDLQEEQALNVTLTKTPASQKKKKRTSVSQKEMNEPDSALDTSLNKSSSDKKKKSSLNVTKEIELYEKDLQEEQANNVSLIKTPVSQKKKKKHTSVSQKEINDGIEEVDINTSLNKTPNNVKKKKQPSISIDNDQTEPLIEDVSKIKTPGSQKKKEKSQENVQESLNVSKIKTPGSQKKKVQESQEQPDIPEMQVTSSKKRKRSLNMTVEEIGEDGENNVPTKLNESLIGSQKKKLKISQQSEEGIFAIENNQEETKYADGKKQKKLKKPDNLHVENENPGIEILQANRNKRKQREDDDENIVSKVLKQNSFDKKVPRLPPSILNQLDENPQKEIHVSKKAKVISTTDFVVEETRKRRNKPSNYLEESVYLNDDESENKKLKKHLHKPKVLPFVPTALTSGSGYTTNFKVNVIPKEIKFIAQTSNISNFKQEYINKRIKRQGTYELYKRNRNIKISKF